MAGLVVSQASNASMRNYTAGLENSMWKVTQKGQLSCDLEHTIPNYGKAIFSRKASKEQNLYFALDMLRLPANYDLAAVKSIPPAWKPGAVQKDITEMQLLKQYDGSVPMKEAWTMLTELEQGNVPTFYYKDWYSDFDKVVVGLSAINFKDNYYSFLNCTNQLLPFTFEDISYTVLTYEFGTTELSKESKKRLAMIGDYLKNDANIESVSIDAYTDSYGGRDTNFKMSLKRGNGIKDYFVKFGVDAEAIKVIGHGEKRHASSNQTAVSRNKNRRVVIQMNKA